MLKDLPYDTLRDFTPVTLMVIVPGVMTMNPKVPAKNLKEVIALAKAKPSSLNYGSPGPLTSGHLSMEMLKLTAGINIQHVPYEGGAPAIAESGVPGFDTYEWYGVFAPGKLPKDVLAKLSREIARIIKLPDMSEKLSAQGAIPVGNTSDEFAAFVKREMDTWGKVAQQVGLKPD